MSRQTEQQLAIRRTFESIDRPLGVREVLAAARKQVPRLGLATVYRTLKNGVEEGWLVRLEIPGEARYERAGKLHHHHFHCRHCDRVFEVPGCVLPRGAAAPRGFEVEGHEMLLRGSCRDCS